MEVVLQERKLLCKVGSCKLGCGSCFQGCGSWFARLEVVNQDAEVVVADTEVGLQGGKLLSRMRKQEFTYPMLQY